jgi:hypothetical protein
MQLKCIPIVVQAIVCGAFQGRETTIDDKLLLLRVSFNDPLNRTQSESLLQGKLLLELILHSWRLR